MWNGSSVVTLFAQPEANEATADYSQEYLIKEPGNYVVKFNGLTDLKGVKAANNWGADPIVVDLAYVTPKSGGFNVKVNKVNSETTGYKVYWTRDASFKKFNVMTVSGSTLNKTIAGKKGMTYYVRVVPVSVVNGKTYVGVQNATHSVKIK